MGISRKAIDVCVAAVIIIVAVLGAYSLAGGSISTGRNILAQKLVQVIGEMEVKIAEVDGKIRNWEDFVAKQNSTRLRMQTHINKLAGSNAGLLTRIASVQSELKGIQSALAAGKSVSTISGKIIAPAAMMSRVQARKAQMEALNAAQATIAGELGRFHGQLRKLDDGIAQAPIHAETLAVLKQSLEIQVESYRQRKQYLDSSDSGNSDLYNALYESVLASLNEARTLADSTVSAESGLEPLVFDVDTNISSSEDIVSSIQKEIASVLGAKDERFDDAVVIQE